MKLKLKIWRQQTGKEGGFVDYPLDNVSPDMSFLEMLDVLNEELISKNEEPVAFEHDCREGICGSCSMMINGEAHGPEKKTTACQLHMRHFEDQQTVVIEPWRAKAFPVIKDLVVDRAGLDRIIQAGGFISVNTGGVPDANLIPIPKELAELSMDAASCIGCGACVAACPNGSAMLFTAAKVAQLNSLPQGKVEADKRTVAMVEKMDQDFGGCTNFGECQEACPKGISINFIGMLNRDYLKAKLLPQEKERGTMDSQ